MENRPFQQFIRKIIPIIDPQQPEEFRTRMMEKYPDPSHQFVMQAYAWDSLLGYGVQKLIQGKLIDPRLAELLDLRFEKDKHGRTLAVLGMETIHETYRKNNVARYYVVNNTDGLPDYSAELISMGTMTPAPQDFGDVMQRHEENFRDYIRLAGASFMGINDTVARPYDPDKVISFLDAISSQPRYIGIDRTDLYDLQKNPLSALISF